MKASLMFSFQVDESTDVTSCVQLLVFVRYIHSGDIEAELLFCEKLQTTTTNAGVPEEKPFFDSAELQWKYVCGVCTDGAPAMMGLRSGIQKKFKGLLLKQKVHCGIHRYVFARKTHQLF